MKITAAVLSAAAVISCSGCLKYTSNILEVTTPGAEIPSETTSQYMPDFTTAPQQQEYTTIPMTTLPEPSSEDAQTTAAPAEVITTAPAASEPASQETTAAAEPTAPQPSNDPSTWSKEQILSFAKESVNKTKAFTGNVSAKHTENTTVNVTKAPGGSMVSGIVNKIIGGVIEPTDETLNFAGGKATNTEGETVQLLLPKAGPFSLDISGVASASASMNGANTVVTITLPSEVGTLTTPPVHNAASIGYLDASTLDLSAVTVNYLDITYKGSKMVLTVNPDGYVVSAEYSVPLGISAEGKALGMTAQIEAEGQDVEKWSFTW